MSLLLQFREVSLMILVLVVSNIVPLIAAGYFVFRKLAKAVSIIFTYWAFACAKNKIKKTKDKIFFMAGVLGYSLLTYLQRSYSKNTQLILESK